jgi:hypothetical protein
MDTFGQSHIMIAHPLTADEALALLDEPAVAVLFDLDDFTVEADRALCTSDAETVVCHVPLRTAVRIAGHRVSLEFHDGGFRDGSGWFISIRGLAHPAPARSSVDAGSAPLPTDLVPVRVTPASVRASRFDPVGTSARHAADAAPEVTS